MRQNEWFDFDEKMSMPWKEVAKSKPRRKTKAGSQKECIGDKDWLLLVDISAKRLDPADNLNARLGQEERRNLIRSTVATIIRTWPQLRSVPLWQCRRRLMKASEIDGCECWLNVVRGSGPLSGVPSGSGQGPQLRAATQIFWATVGRLRAVVPGPHRLWAFEVARCGSNLCFNLSLKTMHNSGLGPLLRRSENWLTDRVYVDVVRGDRV